MASLLETLFTLVGVILILSLAAQSLQEIVKAALPVKAMTRQQQLRSVLTEATLASGLSRRDGEALCGEVILRLRGLGQSGWRSKALRLDSLDAEGLYDIMEDLNTRLVPGLEPLKEEKRKDKLIEIRKRAKKWFPLALGAVSERHKRRMRVLSLLTSAAIVLLLNADAVALYDQARSEEEFRGMVEKTLESLPSSAQAPGSADRTAAATEEELRKFRKALLEIQEDDELFAAFGSAREWRNPQWWVGILTMTFLVSMGAPFWHELLQALLGLRHRAQGKVTVPPTTGEPPKEEPEGTKTKE